MNKRTLTIYEIAWNMHQTGSKAEQIAIVVKKHQATVYRWIKQIKISGIKRFLARKKTAKHRRPSSRTPETTIQKIVDAGLAKLVRQNARITDVRFSLGMED